MRQITFFLICLPFIGVAQVDYFGRTYSNQLPEAFQLNITELRNNIYNDIPEKYKNEKYGLRTFKFADMSANQVADIVSGGSIYSDWMPFEDYLNEIFRKVIPEELSDDPSIHAYLRKASSYNASMTPTGMSFVNIGLFDEAMDEATVAGILAHELAHYYLQHSLVGFVKAIDGDFDDSIFRRNKGAASRFSIKNELQADSLAMVWLQQSGYAIDGLIESFKIMERIEKNQLMRSKNRWEITETTHPRSKERLSRLNAFKKQHAGNKGAKFLVSEAKFKQFSTAAKPEILKHLLNGFSYNLLIEKAFKYHIFDANNPVFVYYIMEGIRRMCYLNPEYWDEKFISHRYYDEIIEEDSRRKEKTKTPILAAFPRDILSINPKVIRTLQTRFYWDEAPRFTTNEEAFVFFYRVSELMEAKECILVNALSITNNKDIRNKFLKKYLAYEDIQFRDFAQSLLDEKIKSTLPDKKLTVFSDIFCIVRLGKEEIKIRDEANNDNSQLQPLFEKVMAAYPERNQIFLPDLKKTQLNDYQQLQRMQLFTFVNTLAKGIKTELHILNPRYWETMNRLGVNEIEFINCMYYDVRKKNSTIEGYKEVLNIDYNTLLTDVKRSRYVDILVSSVREKENSIMKVHYYGGENKLAFKEAGLEQVVTLLQQKIKEKEESAKEIDRRYAAALED